MVVVGCSDEGSLSITGELTYQGIAVPGEISFEPLDADGKSVGRATSITVPAHGSFRVHLPKIATESQPYRLTVRVSAPNTASTGSPINANAFGANVKTVSLVRTLKDQQTLHLAITQ